MALGDMAVGTDTQPTPRTAAKSVESLATLKKSARLCFANCLSKPCRLLDKQAALDDSRNDVVFRPVWR